MHLSRTRLGLILVSTLALSTSMATGAVRAHRSAGTAQFTSPTTFVGSGQATHLGQYSETGSLALTPTSNPAVFHVVAANVYVAADGAELWASVEGELDQSTGVIDATVTYVGGTGRFAGASGSAELAGQIGTNGTISINVVGTVDY